MSRESRDQGGDPFLERMALPGGGEVTVAGEILRPGSRVRLVPGKGGDILDTALAGRVAIVEGIDEDEAGNSYVAVVLEDDPGRDLGEARHPAHRFFFAPAELEPLGAAEEPRRRVLVAGIGNIFLGDDGFGVAVAQTLAGRRLPEGAELYDFGIRGVDLAYALTSGYHAAILVDLVPRGGKAGTIYLVEPDALQGGRLALDSHQMDPLAVLALARELGSLPSWLLIVGCEPGERCGESMSMEMTAPVDAAVEPAAEMVLELAGRLLSGEFDPAEGFHLPGVRERGNDKGAETRRNR